MWANAKHVCGSRPQVNRTYSGVRLSEPKRNSNPEEYTEAAHIHYVMRRYQRGTIFLLPSGNIEEPLWSTVPLLREPPDYAIDQMEDRETPPHQSIEM